MKKDEKLISNYFAKKFVDNKSKSIFAAPKYGSLAQLVQSICLTSRGSLVRTQ
jgi:hypothetical protein